MVDDDHTWFDEEAGPLVRPYAITGGRTRTKQPDLDLITLVVASRRHADPSAMEPESVQILTLCQSPMSVAEISAKLNLPLGVVKVLLGDLIQQRFVHFRGALAPDNAVLQAVLNGIRRL
jgi:Protein of unknown function (DUF742)